ncbi:MAG: hypothetical protein WBW53_21025 [Terriglobales bacterium]
MKRFCFVVTLFTNESDYQRKQAAAAQLASTRLGVAVQILFAKNASDIAKVARLSGRNTSVLLRPDLYLIS